MAECVTLTSNGTLMDDGPVSASSTSVNCAGYVLIDGTSYGVVYPVVQAAYGVPTATEAVGWFVGMWTLVVFFYVIARCAGTVINMIK